MQMSMDAPGSRSLETWAVLPVCRAEGPSWYWGHWAEQGHVRGIEFPALLGFFSLRVYSRGNRDSLQAAVVTGWTH